ncbi:5-formyltetrahydrofolate cyclo-ligase [Rhizobium sp. Root482]|uniref:5-formyltetrahydrofolate cyclo-ligase n=1 Tax=Rhizobium sp. Root482 TaxID=1736543 RepID=UPI0006F63460|nr:5-formyltetrahydrofolate cyclo-ligase [Rhizobium sp. Root482]KQY11245.1 5-formyltetrahydrofolate cyclo-ligase [Rhizobium sp. Root482]
MTPRELKAVLRKERLALRDSMLPQARLEASLAMLDHAGDTIAFEPGEVISGFSPIRSEADIRPLMARLRERGARICVPAVIDRQTILFREIVPCAPLVETGFGTFGPDEDAAVLDPDIMLLPLSAFDDTGHRIGYGGGYYDRAIERLRRKGHAPRLIGIAFDCQEVASVPAEPHDVALDAMLTESGLRTFGLGTSRYETFVSR